LSSGADPGSGPDAAEQQSGVNHALVQAVAAIAEPGEAGHHIHRIQLYVRALAQQLRQSPP
jgi:hypothetical protein